MPPKSTKGNQSAKEKSKSKAKGKQQVHPPTPFELVVVKTRSLDSQLALLASHENVVLFQCLEGLRTLMERRPEEIEEAIRKDCISIVSNLVRSSTNVHVQAAGMKLLSEMAKSVLARDELARDWDLTAFCLKQYKESTLPLIQEASALCLSKITLDVSVCKHVTELSDLNILFTRLTSPDPDVQYNSLSLLYNLLQDIDSATYIVNLKDFFFANIMALFLSDYPSIQTVAFDVVDCLTSAYPKEEVLKKLFCDENGLEKVYEVIEKFAWSDTHMGALNVLGNLCDREETAHLLEPELMSRLITYMLNIEYDLLIEKTMEVILKLSMLEHGKKVLLDNGAVEIVTQMISDGTELMRIRACKTLGYMVGHHEVREAIEQSNPIFKLVDILVEDNISWELKETALCTIFTVISKGFKFAFSLNRKINVLINWLLKVPIDIPDNIMNYSLKCLLTLSEIETTREEIICPDLVKCLINCIRFDRAHPEVHQMALETLANILKSSKATQSFIYNDGTSAIMHILLSEPDSVLGAAANAISSGISTNNTLLMLFIGRGCLSWLVNNKDKWRKCPELENTVDKFFELFLPAKFAYTGKLGCQDKITSGFYVMRTPASEMSAFPVLIDILRIKAVPIRPVYIVNFERSEVYESNLIDYCKVTRNVELRTSLAEEAECVKTLCFEDYNLQDYMDKLLSRQKLLETELCFSEDIQKVPQLNEKWITGTVNIIAELVSRVLNGPEEKLPCKFHTLDLHLREIMVSLASTIIPIGELKVGLKFERAILFKALADRLNLPCWLYRSEYAVAWNEIGIPNLKESNYSELPKTLLIPTHVVDLMTEPGKLFPVSSYDADLYCGRPLKPKILTRVTNYEWARTVPD